MAENPEQREGVERAIIVKGASVNDAVNKGMMLLGVSERNLVTYEILQEGSRGNNGSLGTPYKLRVTLGAPSSAAPLPTSDELDLMAFLGGGIVAEESAPASLTDLSPDELEALSGEEFIDLIDRVAATAVPEPTDPNGAFDPTGIAPDSGVIAAVDGEVVVEVAPNRMEAFVTVTPAVAGGREATTADIDAALAGYGVRYGIDAAAVADAAARRATRVRVAAGLPPQPGRDASVRYVGHDGAIVEEMPLGREVKPEVVVAVKVPPSEGAAGKNVFGEVLPAYLGRDVSLHGVKGKNVRVSPNGGELVATAVGIVSLTSGKVSVENTLVLDRDVTSASGRIQFVGDVLITGSVLRGVAILAGGNVRIQGNVDVAVVQAGGNVEVGGGIRGRGVGTVRAGGSITCRFLEDAKVKAGVDVTVDDYARNGEVQAGRRAVVNGTVLGGQIYGVQSVKVRIAGNENGVTTTLIAGSTLRNREDADRVRQRVQVLVERVAAIERETAAAVQVERDGRPLLPTQRLAILKMVEEAARLRFEIDRIQSHRVEGGAGSNGENPRPPLIAVTGKAFAKTRILIDDTALELSAATQYAQFSDGGTLGIRMTSLT